VDQERRARCRPPRCSIRDVAGGCFWLDQLDPISEGIIDEDSVVTLQRLVVGKGASGGFQSRGERRQIIDDKGRVSLSGRDEIFLHPEVNFNSPSSNQQPPRAASSGGLTASGMPRMPW
jgi:hypothetical protein